MKQNSTHLFQYQILYVFFFTINFTVHFEATYMELINFNVRK